MVAEAVDGVVVEHLVHGVMPVVAALAALHRHGDERVHAVQGPAHRVGIGDGPLHVFHVAASGGNQVQHAEVMVVLEVGRDGRPDETGTAGQEQVHGEESLPRSG